MNVFSAYYRATQQQIRYGQCWFCVSSEHAHKSFTKRRQTNDTFPERNKSQ